MCVKPSVCEVDSTRAVNRFAGELEYSASGMEVAKDIARKDSLNRMK